ncbi:YgaP family membrane protein [Alkalimarinus sediminis]|uniref:DUF2892 domain-containing protein n=1 Tax=Alkalimarinus sediminis TaxID=1632866 RepID=A0A9E8KI13_9ALTE|nr:DUF2892 domain-containing protein [Alkalimarinus sediminis]UZW73461.1 DUF2892 domain-containing protein [Alkalimarinus sediminis]
MTINEALRVMAGIMILVSVTLSYYVAQEWLFLTLFVGLNLIQSAFTKWCPAMWAFRKLGLKEG